MFQEREFNTGDWSLRNGCERARREPERLSDVQPYGLGAQGEWGVVSEPRRLEKGLQEGESQALLWGLSGTPLGCF